MGAPIEIHEIVTELPSLTVMSDPVVIVVLASTALTTGIDAYIIMQIIHKYTRCSN